MSICLTDPISQRNLCFLINYHPDHGKRLLQICINLMVDICWLLLTISVISSKSSGFIQPLQELWPEHFPQRSHIWFCRHSWQTMVCSSRHLNLQHFVPNGRSIMWLVVQIFRHSEWLAWSEAAEAAVKTVKCLFRKCKESGISEFRALLDWRNTPTEGMTSSPSQRFMGRRCKTLLPTTSRLLHPRFETEQTTRELCDRQAAQKIHNDKAAHALDPLQPGDSVRMRLPGCDWWSPGVVEKLIGPRSYKVRVDGVVYLS